MRRKSVSRERSTSRRYVIEIGAWLWFEKAALQLAWLWNVSRTWEQHGSFQFQFWCLVDSPLLVQSVEQFSCTANICDVEKGSFMSQCRCDKPPRIQVAQMTKAGWCGECWIAISRELWCSWACVRPWVCHGCLRHSVDANQAAKYSLFNAWCYNGEVYSAGNATCNAETYLQLGFEFIRRRYMRCLSRQWTEQKPSWSAWYNFHNVVVP